MARAFRSAHLQVAGCFVKVMTVVISISITRSAPFARKRSLIYTYPSGTVCQARGLHGACLRKQTRISARGNRLRTMF